MKMNIAKILILQALESECSMQDRYTDRQNKMDDASLVSGSSWLWVALLGDGVMGTCKTSSQGQRVGRGSPGQTQESEVPEERGYVKSFVAQVTCTRRKNKRTEYKIKGRQ